MVDTGPLVAVIFSVGTMMVGAAVLLAIPLHRIADVLSHMRQDNLEERIWVLKDRLAEMGADEEVDEECSSPQSP